MRLLAVVLTKGWPPTDVQCDIRNRLVAEAAKKGPEVSLRKNAPLQLMHVATSMANTAVFKSMQYKPLHDDVV
ncbi:hypothetical protein STCU_12360 [Strigomonas culicis]|uniref:Uncharacterized protein n=1 Tax=Strigomonas culicis TaxID=28005 RepID=S9UK88_9TRYP|nr:hypothetical protein STCU_12360 [Strigomonas culicis]|eukprot:EPY15076.1 hypothetical protein STCU_12360 [Strigomonas culicis]